MSQVHKNSSDLEEEEEVGGVLCCVVLWCVVLCVARALCVRRKTQESKYFWVALLSVIRGEFK